MDYERWQRRWDAMRAAAFGSAGLAWRHLDDALAVGVA